MTIYPFHLAIPVSNLEAARQFYVNVLGCSEGRSDEKWVDLNLFGHQLVIHYKSGLPKENIKDYNPVDGHDVPIPHFGVVLNLKEWSFLADRLKKAGIQFIIEPYVRFKGQVGEQHTMFFLDPSGNALEFKAFENPEQLFAK